MAAPEFVPMKRIPLLLLFFLLVGLPGWTLWSQRRSSSARVISLVGRMPEQGGWSIDAHEVEVGQPVIFRLTSADVMHGLAIGRIDVDAVDVEPGKWSQFEWTPSQPGHYTFYCTRWCGPNHWRMTGTIQVVDWDGSLPTLVKPASPRYLELGQNIDERPVLEDLEGLRPSSVAGAAIGISPSQPWVNPSDLDLTTPEGAFYRLIREPALQELSDEEIWNLLAYLWMENLDQASIQAGGEIYQSFCAACHGPAGGGDGVMADYFTDPPVANFTDLTSMATVNSVILEGKILRGGMGTGMPYWGTILTEEEINAVSDYLWSLLFTAR